MKRFSLGLVLGLITGLILATTTFALAADQIKLIVNGKEIQCDVPPQLINGRTLVPARFLAEALGATVEWDGVNRAVVVTSENKTDNTLSEYISIRELSNIPDVKVISDTDGSTKILKGDTQIVFRSPASSSSELEGIVFISGKESGIITLKIVNGTSFLPKNQLIAIGLIAPQ